MKLTEITIYPVKSCAGISLQSTIVDRFGASGDRRWRVINEAGRFLTPRDVSSMARIGVSLTQQELILPYSGTSITIPLPVRMRRSGRCVSGKTQ
jgi:uncharacterized protein YcbX